MILDLKDLQNKYGIRFNGVLHIGAHSGGEYPLYKELGVNPCIFIEPQPNMFKELKEMTGEDAICFNVAAGNYIGEIELWTNDNDRDGASSVLQPKIVETQYPNIKLNKKIIVPITKIDSLNIPQTNFINIDIQGYELEALKGAKVYLDGVDYIMSEVNREELYEGCANVTELDFYLARFGFIRVETNWAGGNWGDAFYIKQK